MPIPVTPSSIASSVLDTIHQLLGDVAIHPSEAFGTQALGNTVTLNSGEAVVLDKIDDVAFWVSDDDLALSVDDFDRQILAPAVEALAYQMRRNALAAGEGVVLVTAPLDFPPFDGPWTGASRDGLSVRVVFDEPEDGRRVVHVDVLYGLADTATVTA